MRPLIVVFALGLAGCAGTAGHREILRNDGALAIRTSDKPGVDFVVTARNVVDIGYNPDNPETRKQAALGLANCPAGSIVGEKAIRTGDYLGGRPAITYEMDVRCPKA